MIVEKLGESHFQSPLNPPTDFSPFSATPCSIPCGFIPLNGTDQALKPAHFQKWIDNLSHKLNVRGTFDLSSPHMDDDEDQWSSNSFCDLDPELNMPWVTPEAVAHAAAVLRAIGSSMKFWKVDLHRSYQQLVMQHTLTWRQYIY